MRIRPIDIARKLNISTTALRHYENWGIIPPVERAANGYRVYTDMHVAYFECIRAMNDGFGMQQTALMMKKTVLGDINAALWIMSECQAALHRDKLIADKTIQALEADDIHLLQMKKGKQWMSIGEVSDRTTIPTSAIRHWEKAGLIEVQRDKDNGYRMFSAANLRQILIIRTLKTAFWSLDIIKRIIKELKDNNVETAMRTARESLKYLNDVNRNQLRGAYYFHRLLSLLDNAAK